MQKLRETTGKGLPKMRMGGEYYDNMIVFSWFNLLPVFNVPSHV
uniref:Uncharacterized protein n=1 Tax=Rhizophora mucronata TaxID=61149 RepID=A0A2P2Q319_RHIMU